MNKFRFTINVLAIAIFTFAFASMAQAQATRTWVSGVGDDANPCSRTAPCKTFAGAISKTAAGGEIDALDPGGFGAVTITKAMTIDGGGGQVASVLVAGTNGIVIQAGVGDFVTLTNLRLQGARQNPQVGGGLNAIQFNQGAGLNVINCYIWNFTQAGINVTLNQSQSATVLVQNSTVKNCSGDGISVTNANTGIVKTTLDHSTFVDNSNGVHAKAGSRVDARNCVFSMNSSNGVFADAVGGGTIAVARVWASQISFNGGNGVQAGNGGDAGISVVEIAQDQINNNTGNGALVSSGAGGTAVNTFTNNSILGNGTDGCPSCTASGPGS